ncbi:metallophosphoesterase [Robiginitalea sp. SC105]|nr:metallophosphoesterase [Robiginitalea sp. SC105]
MSGPRQSLSLASCLVLLFLVACRDTPVEKPRFTHDVAAGPTPWNLEEFEATEPDFTFAVISDLNGGERPGVFSRAVEQLNQLDPTFVLSVGDLIDGGTRDTLQLQREWDFFDARANRLNMPFFHLGGNHDLTNATMREFWENRYGPRYYHFVFEDVLFLMLDSEDYSPERMEAIYQARDSALRMSDAEYEASTYYRMPERNLGGMGQEQLAYFREVIHRYPNARWTFLLMHKPLWLREDGMSLTRDSAPLEALEKELSGRNYTVINGHFHRMSHRKRHGMDYLILGTTGGSQVPGDSTAFDHVSLIRMAEKPVITHLRMDGILEGDGTLSPGRDPDFR